jgi:4-aminobutyrate aminotransferase-like enzyme
VKSTDVLRLLRAYESRNVTFMADDGSWPIVWARARGSHVWDLEGRRYLDLTAAFGVAAAGHANPRVVRAGRQQMGLLLHAMGDVHPHPLKGVLARALSRLTFERWGAGRGKVILGNSGFEAVEAALKTARLATGRPGIVAFEGAYHGVGYGALCATHRDHFRAPFRDQLREFGRFAPYPRCGGCACRDSSGRCEMLASLEGTLRRMLSRGGIGAILAEPAQGRGGIWIPAPGFLGLLRRLADEYGVLLIFDEIYTGFGRTGKWFASEWERVVPDLVCLGKALTGGFPLSACVGRAALMDAAWPEGTGEAIHTSTYLGHPVGCAMAMTQIEEVRRLRLVSRAARMGGLMAKGLQEAAAACRRLRASVRCRGLFAGIELRHPNGAPAGADAMTIIRRALARGYLFLPEGPDGEVISLTPPLVIARRELLRAMRVLQTELARY